MTIRELLGRRLKDFRKRRKLTQEKLAELASVDVSYLGNIERGRENPTVETLEKLGSALGVQSYQILISEHELTGERPLRRRINQILEKCDQPELQLILKLIRAVKD